MIKNLVQESLDNVLYPKNIFVHEQRKSGADADEYVVYSSNGDTKEDYADNETLILNGSVTIKYYYRTEKLDNYASRQEVKANEDLIESTLESVGFSVPYGHFDAGDIDDIGFCVTVFECEYWRTV